MAQPRHPSCPHPASDPGPGAALTLHQVQAAGGNFSPDLLGDRGLRQVHAFPITLGELSGPHPALNVWCQLTVQTPNQTWPFSFCTSTTGPVCAGGQRWGRGRGPAASRSPLAMSLLVALLLWEGLAGGYSCPFLSRVLHWVVWKFPAKLPLAEPLTWAVRAVRPVVFLSPWAQWPPSAAFSLPAGEPAGRTKMT